MIDVQATKVTSSFKLASVGVTGLEYPIVARDDATGEEQATVAQWRLGVELPASQRGTHMSRFVAGIEAAADQPMGVDAHFRFARELCVALGAENADISTEFRWFRSVRAPVSGLKARLVSTVALLSRPGIKPQQSLVVKVAAKALCPCSKAIADRGAHNQRSDIAVQLDFVPGAAPIAYGLVLSLIEQSASSPIYPLLKREDEKYITEFAYDHPVFVEDIVRGVADKLVDMSQLLGFTVEATNRESIHAHDCYARLVYLRP